MKTLILAAALLAACGRTTTDAPSSTFHLTIVSGNPQTVPVSTKSLTPLTIKVTDVDGLAVPNVIVQWVVTAGGGTMASTVTQTDNTGTSSNTFMSGGTAGTSTVTVSVGGLGSVAFQVTVTP